VAAGLWFVFQMNLKMRRAHEERLQRRKKEYQGLVENIPDVVARLDRELRIVYVNAALEGTFGVNRSNLFGKSSAEAGMPVSMLEGWLENLKLVLASGTEGRLEVEAPMPTGATYFHVRLVPEFSSENIVETILVIGRDMTRRRQMEEAIREAQIAAEAANQAKSRFLAHMSHEVRTPLNGLLGVNSILLESGLAKEQQQLAQVVQKSGEALLAIVNDVLDLSKIESGKLVLEDTDFDLSAVLSQVTQLHAARASRKGVTICTELDPAIPRWVRSDAMRLQQVLNNLVSNAIKFSDSGSVRLCVALREVDAGQMNVAFSVADQGIGIAPEACAHIFEPFRQGDASTTRRFGGTGLGLTICREIVELMGGHLAVESEVGKGSTFSFALKFRPGQAVSGENSNGDELVLPHLPLSVLVAEDGELNQFVLLHQLEQFGCRVQAVPDGKAAVAKAMTEQFDLILMDCQMPVMDGYEATGAIRRWEETSGGRMRIVALTAHALPEERERCLIAGMDDHLTKPVRVQQLQAILESVAANQVAKSEANPKEASEG
jgi:PAS domain S-box-containing protein